jgi:hypothetical protein
MGTVLKAFHNKAFCASEWKKLEKKKRTTKCTVRTLNIGRLSSAGMAEYWYTLIHEWYSVESLL